jgi:ADP-heptose:LPS heptosyltransferase
VFNRITRKLNRCLTSTALHRVASLLLFPRRCPKSVVANISKAKRILVLKPDGIGDVILATGFLRSIRQQCPDAHITIAVRRHSKELVEHPCFGDEIMIWNEEWCGMSVKPKSAMNLIETAYTTWKPNHLDWVLIPRSGWDHANASMYAWWSGSSNICAHEYFCVDRGLRRNGFVNHLIPTSEVTHEIEFHRRMLQFLSLDYEVQPEIEIPVFSRRKIDELLSKTPIPFKSLALGIGASHSSKRWPAGSFKTLAQHLILKWPDIKLFLIGGTEDRETARLIHDGLGGAIFDTTGRLSISETAALLQKCDVFVGNNSGPIHLAAAVGCAVIEISKHPLGGHSAHECSPVRFGPVAEWSCVLQPESLEPECQEGCDKSNAHCITSITVGQVMAEISQAFAIVGNGNHNRQ